MSEITALLPNSICAKFGLFESTRVLALFIFFLILYLLLVGGDVMPFTVTSLSAFISDTWPELMILFVSLSTISTLSPIFKLDLFTLLDNLNVVLSKLSTKYEELVL